jgi:hypothetical protein
MIIDLKMDEKSNPLTPHQGGVTFFILKAVGEHGKRKRISPGSGRH